MTLTSCYHEIKDLQSIIILPSVCIVYTIPQYAQSLKSFPFHSITQAFLLHSLGENDIHDDGASALTNGLSPNTTLEKLE